MVSRGASALEQPVLTPVGGGGRLWTHTAWGTVLALPMTSSALRHQLYNLARPQFPHLLHGIFI